MDIDWTDIPLMKNETKERFELEFNGSFVFMEYWEMGHTIALTHTEAEPALLGTGGAKALVEKSLKWIEEEKRKILPYCPYVFAFIKKHPEWIRLVDPAFTGYQNLLSPE